MPRLDHHTQNFVGDISSGRAPEQLISQESGICQRSPHTFVSASNSPLIYLVSHLLSNYLCPDCEEATDRVSSFTALQHEGPYTEQLHWPLHVILC